jgi:hypothetical protein
MSFRYFLKWIYWKLIYQHTLANKIYKLHKTNSNRSKLATLLSEWRNLRTKYDGAEYDKSGYFAK